MELVEREAALEDLRSWLSDVDAGEGRLVWLCGEAGVGKSALIRQFARAAEPAATVLVGACDPLSTPRPLGPLADIAPRLSHEIDRLVREGTHRDDLFRAFTARLQKAERPLVLIFEDVHWADQATLDLLVYLGRRIAETQTLLLASYRDDEVGHDHPLLRVTGNLATTTVTRRLQLEPLSRGAVADLAAGTGIDPDDLYQRTQGNPFFLTEVLASPGDIVPRTVRDAVHARVARLSAPARRALEAASVIGFRIEPWLLVEVAPDDADAVDECLQIGMLESSSTLLSFRHELARQAVLASLPPLRRLLLNRTVLAVLRDTPTLADANGTARLAHHAEEAGDADAVLAFAPAAARRAAQLKAHREAGAQYTRALRFLPAADRDARAELLEALAYESYLTSDIERAMQAREEALEIRRELGDRLAEGDNLRWISRLSWFRGRQADARAAAKRAIDTLEAFPDSLELAWAYSNHSQLCMLADLDDEAVRWGERALELGRRLGDVELQAHALNNVGTALLGREPARGLERLERALSLSIEHDLEEHAARAYTNLAASAVEARQLERAERHLTDGIGYCVDRDLDAWTLYMRGWQATLDMRTGRWREAAETAHAVLAHPRLPTVSRIQPLLVLALVRARRGDGDVQPLLRDARELAESTGEVQRIAPVAAAAAEHAWLRGTALDDADQLTNAYRRAVDARNAWAAGELAVWLALHGLECEHPEWIPEPYMLELAGRPRLAARAWTDLGCRYDAARVLIGSSERDDLLEAFATLTELGATAATEVVRRRLHDLGLAGPPAGPRPRTLANPAQLTKRQLQVLQLMAEGLSNAEIAGRLYRSTKTIDHHVSAVLMKMECQNRTEAVRKAADMGILVHRDRGRTDPEKGKGRARN